MDLSGPGITYAFLVIPALFALVIIVQGLVKIGKQESDGAVITSVGFGFLGLVIATYFFFIR